MKYILSLLVLFVCTSAFSQQWHPANKKLKSPKRTGGYYVTVGYSSWYDTIPCTYIIKRSAVTQKGFKVVYVHNGHYTDNARTFRVFYDERRNRIRNVERFYFN
jgi:hypothetical protein